MLYFLFFYYRYSPASDTFRMYLTAYLYLRRKFFLTLWKKNTIRDLIHHPMRKYMDMVGCKAISYLYINVLYCIFSINSKHYGLNIIIKWISLSRSFTQFSLTVTHILHTCSSEKEDIAFIFIFVLFTFAEDKNVPR